MTDHPDDEALLAGFRAWLQAARAEAEALDREPPPPQSEFEGDEVGFYRLIEEFTALRHELKLQTKSSRGLQEQAEALLPALRQAIEQFRAVAPQEAQSAWSAGRPLAEALADLDEALDRGRAELEKARHRLVEEPARALEAALGELFARQGWPRRWFSRPYHERAVALVRHQDSGARQALLDALLEGYSLIQSRLRRALKAEQIDRIACVGRPVDPERMTVVEVVDAPGRPPGEVVEEVRRGYAWQGRVLRYAEVRAARPPAASSDGRPGQIERP
jgi:molecular chaperone GrpE